ncbi:hypothetical protein F5Y19DRAFT_5090 [Xylariaceae sp. FL1651]|nr:hypothetical protein F5Y19DRAFT_5090 [Xylariaceae sp. FL1651]
MEADSSSMSERRQAIHRGSSWSTLRDSSNPLSASSIHSNPSSSPISPLPANGNSQWRNSHYVPDSSIHVRGILPAYSEETGVQETSPPERHGDTNSDVASHLAGTLRDSISVSECSQRKKSKSPISWWWWWEIGAALLSIISLILLIILLSKANGLRLRSWALPIQPNSLISVLTTIAKTAMMVPVAACLSQLKWRHFLRRPNPLDQFQIMDDASRGPWGSFVLLTRAFKIRALIATALAFITVVGLGFEPSAQQILDFPERVTPETNVSAEVGVASHYTSKAFVSDNTVWKLLPTTDLFKLQSAIVDGISGTVPEPNFNCPSDYCTWEDFTTLGICSAYQNLTSEIKMTCDNPENPLFNCTYVFPDGQGSTSAKNITFGDVGKSQYLRAESFRSWFESTSVQNRSGILSAVKVTNYDLYRNRVPGIGFAYAEPPVTESYFARFYWCSKTFRNVTAIPRQLQVGSVEVEELKEVEYHIGNGCSCSTLSSPSTGVNYTVDSTLLMYLMDYLQFILTQEVVNIAPYSPRIDNAVDLANYLYTTNFENFTVNLATTLTNQIRSADPGDNRNATTHPGIAYSKETYIHVRWPWAILPAVSTIITSALLATSIIISRRDPLFKSSALALLFHGLHNDWPDVLIDQPESSERVEHAAKGMVARLASDDDNVPLQFKRTA